MSEVTTQGVILLPTIEDQPSKNGLSRKNGFERLHSLAASLPESEFIEPQMRMKLKKFTDLLDSNIALLTKEGNSSDTNRFVKAIDIIGRFLFFFNSRRPWEEYNSLKPDVGKFKDFASAFLQNNMQRIERMMKGESWESQRNLLRAVLPLASVVAETKRPEIIDFLLKHAESAIKLSSERDIGKDTFGKELPIFNAVFEYGSASQRESAKQMPVRLIHDPDSRIKQVVAHAIALTLAKSTRRTEFLWQEKDIIKNIVSAFGVNGEKSVELWGSGQDNWHKEYRSKENFLSLQRLESQRPGIGAVLESEFGIHYFSRYPEQLLIKQYDQRNSEANTPYGLIISTRSDWNQALYKPEVYEKLLGQLEGKYRLMAWEVENLLELVHSINKSRHRFGRISFVIIDGHGDKNRILLGGADSNPRKDEYLDTKDLGGKRAPSIHLAFVEHPTIILNSCNPGELGGIGQEISRMGATVIAPTEPTNIASIDIKLASEEEINFKVKYNPETPPQTYRSGL